MPGMYEKGETKIRSGVYHRYENRPPYGDFGTEGIGGMIFSCDWGPINEPITIITEDDIFLNFGKSGKTEAVKLMLQGGASVVFAVRVGGSDGAKASVSLVDDAGASVVKLTAKHEGERALTVTVRENLLNETLKDVIVHDGTQVLEALSFKKGAEVNEVDAIVAAMAESFYIDATKTIDGSEIVATVSQAALVGGKNPTTTNEDYSAALNALNPYFINVTCVDTDAAEVHALLDAHNERRFSAGAHPMSVVAESMSLDINTRMLHAKAFNDAKMIYALNAQYDKDGNIYDGWKLAAYMGGIVCKYPSETSITKKPTPLFIKPAETLEDAQIERALTMGCLVITRNTEGNMVVELGINTLNEITDKERYDEGWKKIRRVKTRYELTERVNRKLEKLVGNIDNDTNGRETVVSKINEVINTMVSENKLLGGRAMVDPSNNPNSDSCWYLIGFDDKDSQERIYLTYQTRYSSN